MSISAFVYSHTDYSDVWPLASYTWKRFTNIHPTYIFVNKDDPSLKLWESRPIFYDEKLSYSKRLKSCLEQINEDMVLYTHEDFILYGTPDISYWFLDNENKKEYDYVRLIKSGELGGTQVSLGIWEIPKDSNHQFCVQASLWRKDKLIEFLDKCGDQSIWSLETDCQHHMKDYNGAYLYTGGKKRGEAHFDSEVFPYMATAIVKGKWNSEYKEELLELNSLFHMDFNGRGWS